MPTAVTIASTAANLPGAAISPDLASALKYAGAEKAVAARKAYRLDCEIFHHWCVQRDVSALPAAPEIV